MSREIDELHERTESLLERLTTEGEMSPEVRAQVVQLLGDLDRRLSEDLTSPSAAASPLTERFLDAARHFETGHPLLGGLLRNMADALSQMGI